MVRYFNRTLANDLLLFDSIYMAIELEEMIEKQKTEKCNVTALPEDHNAVVIEERPSVRIFSKR
jgi:sulfur transfer complex TusBCD TusB component (DsrH family)